MVYPLFLSVPFGNATGYFLLVGTGAVLGSVLGFCFPRVFGFLFETLLEP